MRYHSDVVMVGDFETTTYENQEYTEVWASACVELGTEDVQIFGSIDEQFNYLVGLGCSVIIYYHNLKFDGAFWLDYLLRVLRYRQAYEVQDSNNPQDVVWLKQKDMGNKTFKYCISDMGQWYNIIIKVNNHFIEIRDSLKLLPFSVAKIGKSFATKHKKLDMEYVGYRYAGCVITDEEKEYIKNDVLVVKEALEIMFEQGHKEMTIGSCCLKEFKRIVGKYDYETFYPDLTEITIDKEVHKYSTIDEWIRRSYRGGWCYVVKGKECKLYHNGTTADVNSLYPSVMHSQSGNRYPVGKPKFWVGDFIPNEATKENMYYFIRFRTRFYLKPNKLPFVQIKNSPLYSATENLETSDLWNEKTQSYHRYYYVDGAKHDTEVELTMTMTDYQLFKEHYYLADFRILDGCYFYSEIGLFDEYINKYKKIKQESKGAVRETAKLFLNNLYGKLASNKNSSFKVAFLKEDESIGFFPVKAQDKKAGYIAIGSAITSYARNFTIRAAQKNYYGVHNRGFIYADTDSIHCDLEPHQIQGITVHDTEFCCWKLESTWDVGFFARQKTYIEHIVTEDGEQIEHPYYNIKCAGLPEVCKKMLSLSMSGYKEADLEKYTTEEIEFIKQKRTITDFKAGLKIPSKLLPKRIKGGIVLQTTTYEMR